MGQGRGRRIDLESRLETVELVNRASESGCGVVAACKAVGISRRTYERWRDKPCGDQRRGPLSSPANKLSPEERETIIRIANSAEYCDKSPSQIVPLLADKGRFVASESSFYRVLKQSELMAHRGRSKPPANTKPDELLAAGPNQVYSWDITYLRSAVTGIFFYLYIFMDIYSRKIVGFSVHEEQTSEHAANLVDNICLKEQIEKNTLVVHSDNGSPMKGATMLATLQRLGVIPSFSRPSVSNDNPYSESLFKTLKYCPQYPSKPFESLVSAHSWVEKFVKWYNEEHLHSKINFVTPSSRHSGKDRAILAKRHSVYEQARSQRPERWSGNTRNWSMVNKVFLNPLQRKKQSDKKEAA